MPYTNIYTHTHRYIIYLFYICRVMNANAQCDPVTERCGVSIDVVHRQQMCQCVPPPQPPLTASYPSSSPSCLQWQQIRHDCSQTRFELSRVKSLLKLRDICRALSRIYWQSYIVYATLFSVHKSYANSLAGRGGEVRGDKTIFISYPFCANWC